MITKRAWLMLALALTACGGRPDRPQPIAALAEQRLCPPPLAARAADGPASENRLPLDERLIATEQAIQLDELIKWVRAQAAVDLEDRHAFGP